MVFRRRIIGDIMEIKNAQYVKDKLDSTIQYIEAEINGLKSSVPLNPDNRHYAEILKQVAEGTLTIKDAE